MRSWKWLRIYLHCTGGWEAEAAAIKESSPREWVSEPSIFFWSSPFWHLPASWENALFNSALRSPRSCLREVCFTPPSAFYDFLLTSSCPASLSCVLRAVRLLRKVCMDWERNFSLWFLCECGCSPSSPSRSDCRPSYRISGCIDEKDTDGSFVSPPVNASISDSPWLLIFLHCKISPIALKHAWTVLLMNLFPVCVIKTFPRMKMKCISTQ